MAIKSRKVKPESENRPQQAEGHVLMTKDILRLAATILYNHGDFRPFKIHNKETGAVILEATWN